MRTTPPFTDADELEVIARVALRWTFRTMKVNPELKTVAVATGMALSTLPPGLSNFFPTAFFSIGSYCGAQGWSSRRWLAEVRARAHAKLNFRAVFFFDYKAHRRDPRVTNRGVMS